MRVKRPLSPQEARPREAHGRRWPTRGSTPIVVAPRAKGSAGIGAEFSIFNSSRAEVQRVFDLRGILRGIVDGQVRKLRERLERELCLPPKLQKPRSKRFTRHGCRYYNIIIFMDYKRFLPTQWSSSWFDPFLISMLVSNC